ncbi:MAG: hypothetical protein JWM58_2005 [Rhizobium sp.]|nr:hypothetical protein [Rhizobium sp.]
MTDGLKLSICVPSRNRQETFQQTVRDLIANSRPDIEFVFADNSDDPAVMNDFMAGMSDPRIRYLPAPPETLPMQDNWERSMAAATGDWIIFIGDDDYVDPDAMDVIRETVSRRQETEAIGWSRLSFKWPDYRPYAGNFNLSLKNEVKHADRVSLFRRMFQWEEASNVPASPFTVYHGAVSRKAMENIRKLYGGRYFEHPTVDFDCGSKLLFAARHFVFVSRPLSVLGATAKSNSAAIGRFAKALEIYENFVREKGNAFESGDAMQDFPFKSNLGTASSILSAQHWFKSKYGIRVDGWEANFVKALAKDCSRAIDRNDFDLHVELCRRAITRFEDGKYLDAFVPRFTGASAGIFTGLMNNSLHIDERIGDCQTPAELYALVQAMIEPMSALKFNLEQQRLVAA